MSLPPFNPAPAYRLTTTPDEHWNLGDGLRSETLLGKKWKEDEKAGWKTLDLSAMEAPVVYKFLISAVVPRPIAFVSTLSEDGIRNIAPYRSEAHMTEGWMTNPTRIFSYFSLVSHNPPLVSVSFSLPRVGIKDSRENIKATKEFTVNIISEPFVEAMNATSVDAPPEVDEFVLSGLTPIPSDVVKPPRLRESAITFECDLFHFLDISPSGPGPLSGPKPTQTLVLGRILRAHVRNTVLSSPSSSSSGGPIIDPAALRAISRLGGIKYARVGEGFELPRLSWKEDGDAIRQVVAAKKKETDLDLDSDLKGKEAGKEADLEIENGKL